MNLVIPAKFPACESLGGGMWELLAPWAYEIEGVQTVIPAGFITDLYSAPWWVTWAIPRDEQDNRPALVHDWLYGTVGLRASPTCPTRFTREQCDEALRTAMRMCGFSLVRRNAIHLGVRIGGGIPWGRLDRGGYSVGNPCMGTSRSRSPG